MRIRFWGTRGSLATPGPTTLRYGGNTSCVQRANDGTLIVLDCGTGAHRLGQALMAEPAQPVRGHLMITHTHWDHIQGFRSLPRCSRWRRVDYAPGGWASGPKLCCPRRCSIRTFPVTPPPPATLPHHALGEAALTVGGVRVIAQYLNHPALTLGYRLEADGASVVYAVDHEPHMRDRTEGGGMGEPGEASPHAEDTRHVAFLEGADLRSTTRSTRPRSTSQQNWGHSPAETAVDHAHCARAAARAHPSRSDARRRRGRPAGRNLPRASGGPEASPRRSRRRRTADPRASRVARLARRPRRRAAASTASHSSPAHVVLIADDDPVIRASEGHLALDAFRLYTATDRKTALNIARSVRPSLILLDRPCRGSTGPTSPALRGSDPYCDADRADHRRGRRREDARRFRGGRH